MNSNSLVGILQIQLFQISVLILLAGLLTWFLRNRHPHVAYALWLVVFVKCLTPPVMTTPFGLFAWQSGELNQPAAVMHETPDASKESPVINHPLLASAQPVDHVDDDGQLNDGVVANNTGSQRVSRQDTESPEVAATPPTSLFSLVSTRGSLLTIWLTGMVTVLFIACRQWLRCWQIINETRIETPASMMRLVQRVQSRLEYHRPVRIVLTESEYGPMVFGYLKPVLILPAQLIRDHDDRELQTLIAHELIHLRRGDTLVSLFQFASATVWWFNPLVWWAHRQTNLLCERCCDLEVVEGMNCQPARYARMLLGVVESRRSYKAIVAAAGIRSSEVTSGRLSWLVTQSSGSRRNSRRVGGFAAVLAAILVFPAAGISAPQEVSDAQSGSTPDSIQPVEPNEFAKATMAFNRQQWQEAIKYFRQVLDKDENNSVAWFRTGYALHALGKIDKAIVAHERASHFPNTKRTALYNWACALCLQGNHEEAIAKLTETLDAGFALPRPIDQDTDFSALLKDERFLELVERHKKLVESQPQASRGSGLSLALADESIDHGAWTQLDFWVGDWQVMDENGNYVGTATVSRQENGHMIHEEYSGENGMTGQTFCYFDAVNKNWVQNRVDSLGRVLNLTGTTKGKSIELSGTATLKVGLRAECRVTLKQTDGNQLQQTVEVSKDDGETWETTFNGVYERITK